MKNFNFMEMFTLKQNSIRVFNYFEYTTMNNNICINMKNSYFMVQDTGKTRHLILIKILL